MRRIFIKTIALLTLATAAATAVAEELRPFDANSIHAIREANAGKSFLLVFWSLYCEPCREEMSQWGPLQRKHPDIPIVLVSTDSPGDREAVVSFLARHDLGKVQRWAFADSFTERVRFSVDKKWRGELPRTYFYRSTGEVIVKSGKLSPEVLDAWMAGQRP